MGSNDITVHGYPKASTVAGLDEVFGRALDHAVGLDRMPKPEPNVGPYPKVQGVCPACKSHSLFLGAGGYVTCAVLSCADPCAANEVLTSGREQP